MNRLFLGDDVQGLLVGLLFFLLGMGTLLPVFLILLFWGATLAEDKAEHLPELEPKIEESASPSEQVFAFLEEKADVYHFQIQNKKF